MKYIKNKIAKTLIIIIFVYLLFFTSFPLLMVMIFGTLWVSITSKDNLVDSQKIDNKNYTINIYKDWADNYKYYFKYSDGTEKFAKIVYFNNNSFRLIRYNSNHVAIIRTAFDSSFIDTAFIKLD